MRGFGKDKMCWKSDREKSFTTKDYYNLLMGSNDYCFPWKRETEDSFSSSFLCLDCSFREMLNN